MGTERRPARRYNQAAIDAIRAEIDRWWQPICARLDIVRTWSWMGMPDGVRERLGAADLAEWDELQARYAAVDVA